jgi:hypothetical protein
VRVGRQGGALTHGSARIHAEPLAHKK